MSEHSRSSEAAAGGSSSSPKTPAKPRNPTERIIVWTLIGAMLVLVGIEASAKFGYDFSRSAIESAIATAEDTNVPVTIDQVPGMLWGYHKDTTDEEEYDAVATYRWPSLFKQYGLNIKYRKTLGTVVGYSSDNAPPEEPRVTPFVPADDATASADAGDAGTLNPPEGGEAPRRFDPMQFDADKDGRVSKEEASDRMREGWERIDANADGFADAEELAAWRSSRARPSGDGSPPSEGAPPAGGPQRPEPDAPAADAPAADAPAADAPAADAPAADAPAANAPAGNAPATDAGATPPQ